MKRFLSLLICILMLAASCCAESINTCHDTSGYINDFDSVTVSEGITYTARGDCNYRESWEPQWYDIYKQSIDDAEPVCISEHVPGCFAALFPCEDGFCMVIEPEDESCLSISRYHASSGSFELLSDSVALDDIICGVLYFGNTISFILPNRILQFSLTNCSTRLIFMNGLNISNSYDEFIAIYCDGVYYAIDKSGAIYGVYESTGDSSIVADTHDYLYDYRWSFARYEYIILNGNLIFWDDSVKQMMCLDLESHQAHAVYSEKVYFEQVYTDHVDITVEEGYPCEKRDFWPNDSLTYYRLPIEDGVLMWDQMTEL